MHICIILFHILLPNTQLSFKKFIDTTVFYRMTRNKCNEIRQKGKKIKIQKVKKKKPILLFCGVLIFCVYHFDF